MSDSDDFAPRRKAGFAAGLVLDDSDSSSGDEAPVAKPVAKAPAPASVAAADTKGGKGKKGKKGGKGAADDLDEDALLAAELEKATVSAPAPASKSAAAPAPSPAPAAGASGAKDSAAALLASLGLASTEGESGAEKEEKDKKKKKKRRGGKGGDKGDESGDEDGETPTAAAPAPAPAPAPAGGKGGKMSAQARAAQEALARVREAEARAAAVEAERKRREEEIRLAEEEEERKRREKREEKKRKEREKVAKAKAEGTYMTKKQREELEKRRARLGLAPSAEGEGDHDGDEGSDGEEGGDDAAAAGATDVTSPKAATAAAATSTTTKRTAIVDVRKKKPAASSTPAVSAVAAEPAPAPAPTSALDMMADADDWEAAAAVLLAAKAPTPAPAPAPAPVPAAKPAPVAATTATSSAATAGPTLSPLAALAALGGAGASTTTASTPISAASASSTAAAADSGLAPSTVFASMASDAPIITGRPKSTFVYPAGVPLPGESAGKDIKERIADSRRRRNARLEAAKEARTADRLRSPICVVLGHVDTGKTSLLDKIRQTNVQEGEAGGITQQIGATYFPMDRMRTTTDKLNKDLGLEYKVPGLLIIDTPGHESFVNLRSRGAGLCDIAVLVVDVMHGLERQTIESINLLRSRKTPFVVALNKVDRMYGWKANPNMPIRETLAAQADYAVSEFETRTARVLAELAGQGLNAKLYYENDDFRRNVSVVPTSAVTGEGIPDLLMLIVQLTQQMMAQKLQFLDYVDANVLEVKDITGLGTTIDVVLVSGDLYEGDTIVLCGMEGPIVTQVRALLTPPPMREMRVKADYVHHKHLEAAMGVKIAAHGLERAIAGTSMLVLHQDDDIEDLKKEVMADYESVICIDREPVGVYVQASTLGSLEALLEYLRTHDPPVPVCQINIGPLHKKDVVKASVMLEHKKEYALILAFDVNVTPEAEAAAQKLGVKIFTAKIIYHLTDRFEEHLKGYKKQLQDDLAAEAIFPCIAKIIPTAIFNKRDPIVVGMEILEGKLKVGTPLCVIPPDGAAAGGSAAAVGGAGVGDIDADSNRLVIGRVASLEHDHKAVEEAKTGQQVAVKIVQGEGKQLLMYGRHFDHTQQVLSSITRTSIDVLKEHFKSDLSKADWKLVVKLKGLLGIP